MQRRLPLWARRGTLLAMAKALNCLVTFLFLTLNLFGCSGGPLDDDSEKTVVASVEQEALLRCVPGYNFSGNVRCVYDKNGDGDGIDPIDHVAIDIAYHTKQTTCTRAYVTDYGDHCFLTIGQTEGTAASLRLDNILVNPAFGALSRRWHHRGNSHISAGTCTLDSVPTPCN